MCYGASAPASQFSSGLIEPGNIDLAHRPKVRNPDGSYSTVYTMTIGIENGRAMNIPRVVDGKVVSPEQAIKHARETGQHLGIYENEAAAEKAAIQLHDNQAQMYGK